MRLSRWLFTMGTAVQLSTTGSRAAPLSEEPAFWRRTYALRESLHHLQVGAWAAIGHSEGGMAAWVANEQQRTIPIGGFVGSVALAPAMDFPSTMARWFRTPASREVFSETALGKMYSLFVFEGVRRVQDGLSPARSLTRIGEQALDLVTNGGCDVVAAHFVQRFGLDDIYKEYGWASSSHAAEWAVKTGNRGTAALAGPMLIVQGEIDMDVPANDTRLAFRTHCEAVGEQSPIILTTYPGLDHMAINWAALSRVQEFLDARFTSQPTRNQCREVVVRPSIAASNVAYDFSMSLSVGNPYELLQQRRSGIEWPHCI